MLMNKVIPDKSLILLAAWMWLVCSDCAKGYVLVEDIPNLSANIINEAKNYAQYLSQTANQVTQITNQVTQIENQVIALQRFGNPQYYVNMLGLSSFMATASVLTSGVGQTIFGWAIVHVGTMAGLPALRPPSANASLGELLLSFATLAVVCLWMVVGTIGAPLLIAKMVTSGANFAQGMVGAFASAAGQHAARAMQSGTSVTGALVGGAVAGPGGAAAGAAVGTQVGRTLAAPITSATESAEGINGGRRPIPSSRSAAVADAAIGLIKGRL